MLSHNYTENSGNGERKLTAKRAVTAVVLATIVLSTAYVFYDLNGDSFDCSDRSLVLVITNSMDGDVHGQKVDSFPADTVVMVHRLSDDEKLDIHVGDVLSFRQGSILNHHRVVDISGIASGYVVTQGDNASSRETVPLSDIEGEVVGTNHWLGAAVYFAKVHFTWIVLALMYVAISACLLRWALEPVCEEMTA